MLTGTSSKTSVRYFRRPEMTIERLENGNWTKIRKKKSTKRQDVSIAKKER